MALAQSTPDQNPPAQQPSQQPSQQPAQQPGQQPDQATPDAGGDPATLALERQNFDAAERNLNAAVSSCREIAEAHAEEDQGQGFGGWLSRAVRSCLRWYISPEERYWQTMTDGLGHVVASLKAHEAVLHAHGETVRSTQGECRELVSQLQEVGPGTTAKS